MSPEGVYNWLIWFNSDIKVNGRPIFYKKCFDRGMVYIRDILDNNNESLSFEALNVKFGYTMPFTKYFGIIDAISPAIKQLLKQNVNINANLSTNFMKFINKDLASSFFFITKVFKTLQ